MFTRSKSGISREDVVDSLARLRREWQESIDGESLIDVEASVGLLLGDVVMMLGLTSDEQEAVLGANLRRDFIRAVRQRSGASVK